MIETVPEQEVAQYRRDGICVFRGKLSVAELDALNGEMADLFAIQVRALGLPVAEGRDRTALRTNALALLQADVPRFIAAMRVTQDLPSVHRVLVSAPLLELARALGIAFPVISTKASVHIMDDDLRVPNGYHKSPAHQDWRSIQGSLDNLVLWIPTTPVRGGRNGLEVVRGSHLFGLLDTVEHAMTPSVSDPRITEDRYESIDAEPGDVIAFSSFLVHRTADRGDGAVRIALSTRFNNALEPSYVDRGYPSPYKYSYRLDLMTPDFPPVERIRETFGE